MLMFLTLNGSVLTLMAVRCREKPGSFNPQKVLRGQNTCMGFDLNDKKIGVKP